MTTASDDLRELPTELVGDEVIWELRGDAQGLDVRNLLQEHIPGRPEPSSNTNASNSSRQRTGLEEHVGNAESVGAEEQRFGSRQHRPGARWDETPSI